MRDDSSRSKAPIVVLILVIAILPVALMLVYFVQQQSMPVNTPPSPPSPITVEQPRPKTRYQVASWTGRVNKNTETFHIPSQEWFIEWSGGDGYFSIAVRRPNGDLVDRVVDIIGRTQDSTVMRGIGDYYLDIDARNPYYIGVFAYR